jgi:segregation and condensation protein A
LITVPTDQVRPGSTGPATPEDVASEVSNQAPDPVPAPDAPARATDDGVFSVHLTNFTGPFDLLLQLISKHKLDVTEVALSKVTDEFIGFIKASGDAWDLEQTSQFIVVAATLLDLKAARLLPSGEMTDTEDLALLEARDLLFARLLQYKAYKQIAALLVQRLSVEDRRHPRQVGPDPRFASLLPEVRLTITPVELAALAAKAMAPKQADVISLAHLHLSTVSVREQAALVVDRLRRTGTMTFRALAADAPDRVTTVARFLALLELFREQAVSFEQLTPLGELTIRWTGSESGELDISDEFDEGAGLSASVEAPATTGADDSDEKGPA